MTVTEIRKGCIKALASDDYLMQQLVLKGGNALSLIHGIGHRTSIDLDYSIEEDVEDVAELENHLRSALDIEFRKNQLVVVGEKFQSRPRSGSKSLKFGGYRFEFMQDTFGYIYLNVSWQERDN